MATLWWWFKMAYAVTSNGIDADNFFGNKTQTIIHFYYWILVPENALGDSFGFYSQDFSIMVYGSKIKFVRFLVEISYFWAKISIFWVQTVPFLIKICQKNWPILKLNGPFLIESGIFWSKTITLISVIFSKKAPTLEFLS